MLLPDYASPVVISSTTGTGLQPSILDIETVEANAEGYPPVLQILISATATVVINAALQVSHTNPATLVVRWTCLTADSRRVTSTT